MVLTHNNSTLEKWQVENLYRFQETKCSNKEGSIPIIDEVLNTITRSETYSSLDRILGYHQIFIILEDKYNTTFVTD